MTPTQRSDFLPAIVTWLEATEAIESAVLFGSSARDPQSDVAAGPWSDVDLHIVARPAAALERVDWATVVPDQRFLFHVLRPATGGVKKLTVFYAAGQIDLVIVPASQMTFAQWALRLGLFPRLRLVQIALNEMATCLHTGFRFLKGEARWGALYRRVAGLPGVRLTDAQLGELANGFLCDLLWVLQKVDRGELVAAQHALHTKLVDVNLRLWRELRRRDGLPLPSFGLGRRVEQIAEPAERRMLQVSALATPHDLTRAAWGSLGTLSALMARLQPAWSVPRGARELLAAFGPADELLPR